MRFRSRDQVQNFGLPDLPMCCQGIDQVSRQTEHVVESMADAAGRGVGGLGKLMLVNTTGPIHKLMVLSGVRIVVSPFGGDRGS